MRVTTTIAACAAAGFANAKTQTEFDYVIVGGGLTGLVTAARLTEDPKNSVLVLEYEIIDRSNVTQIPYYGTMLNTAGLRSVMSAPEPHLGDQQSAVRAAQIAGGGSQVNGMQWGRPSVADIDAFAELGNEGWDWKGLQPYYKKAVQMTPPDADVEARYNYSDDLSAHGNVQSPAKISFPEFQYPDMMHLKDAFTELQVPFVEEPAAGNAVGHFWSPSSINANTSTRTSSLYAYYDRVSHRKNLKLYAQHQVTEVIFDEELTATGVKAFDRKKEKKLTFTATKEVVLAAGAIFAPQILQLSGIGPKSVLEAAGVKTKLDFAAVGSNFRTTHSLGTNATFFESSRKLYEEERTGPLTKAQASYVGFLSLQSVTENAEALLADAEATATNDFLPDIYAKDKRLVAGFKAQRDVLIQAIRAGSVAMLELPVSGGGLIPNAMQKPLSRGTVHLNATDPTGVPVVSHNALAHPVDRATIFESLQFTRRLMNSKSASPCARRSKARRSV